jgi:transitional endoplasmic reticulum ATPase
MSDQQRLTITDGESATASADSTRKAILAALDQLGGLTVQEDTLTFEGDRFILPASLRGDIQGAENYLRQYRESQEETYEYSRTYPYRPADGAAAFDRAMKRLFGSTGVGQATYSFFGKQPPQFRTIDVGVGRTLQVPWGNVTFSPLDAVFTTGAMKDPERGLLFVLSVEAPRKHRQRIEGFFDAVARELAEASIYRGKAINGAEEPAFLDVTAVDPSTVVYSADVMTQLNANLWALLDHTAVMRDLKIPLKRAVLVEGPYGTGKTLAGALTAQRAVQNGWTFVLCRPGVDDLMTTLRTAQLYSPAVVWFEDIDIVGSGGTTTFIARLLDALDGVTAKGAEVVAGFTTNHVDRLQKGLLRPGRIDTVIHIGELDTAGIERLIKVTVPERLLGKVDYTKVATAFTGYVPAFAKEAIDRAMRYSIARNGGVPDQVTTDDLVNAAKGLREQHRLMEAAAEGANRPTLDGVFRDVVEGVVARTAITHSYMRDGEFMSVKEVDMATNGTQD